MTDGKDCYHKLTRAERDHLLAVATHDAAQPSGLGIQRRVSEMRGGSAPSNNTSYGALARLAESGLVDKEIIDGSTTAYELTPRGMAFLEQAAAVNPA